METRKYLFTSESVTEGHPDKLCDQISDGVLDAVLEQDPNGRVACETLATTGIVFVAGEMTTNGYIDIQDIVRSTLIGVGYDNVDYGIDGNSCAVISSLDEQSTDIAMGVNDALENRGEKVYDMGAGDQGLVFGYACDETDCLMPMPIELAHQLSKKLAEVRKATEISYLRPDGKSQVTVEYENGKPLRIDTVVLSTQHHDGIEQKKLHKDIMEKVIKPTLPAQYLDEKTKYFINPTGRFVIGGPNGDTGLTGRKIIVDTYGGMSRHGGGALSGKDPSKVDRSACYAARHVAKNIVAAKLASRCEIQIAYAIGVANPVSVMVDAFGTETIPLDQIEKMVHKHFDLRPAAIIEQLELTKVRYKKVASYGHFGRSDLDLPWERLNMVDMLLKDA